MKWRMVKASLVVYAVIGLALWALAGCAHEHYRPCREDFLDDRPDCNEPDTCDCELPWAPWFDHCCLRNSVETVR